MSVPVAPIRSEAPLQELEALANAATPGPWRAGNVESEGKVWVRYADGLAGPHLGERCLLNMNTHFPHTADRKFIAASREAVPRLIATVREARSVSLDNFRDAQRECGERMRAESERDDARAEAAAAQARLADLEAAVRQQIRSITNAHERWHEANPTAPCRDDCVDYKELAWSVVDALSAASDRARGEK